MGKTLAKILTGTVIGAAALGIGGGREARADIIPINSFKDFMGSGSSNGIQNYLNWDLWPSSDFVDNLMYKYPETGEEKIVPNQGNFHVGYINSAGYVGGWASNDNNVRHNYPGYCDGWLSGRINSELDEVKDVWIVWDQEGDGIGTYNTVTGAWYLGPDDIIYFKDDILFGDNRVRGDLSGMPVYSPVDNLHILPSMVIDPLIPPRNEPSDIYDLEAMAANWLSYDCGPSNNDCDGADWNFDGKVDFTDYAHLAGNWLVED